MKKKDQPYTSKLKGVAALLGNEPAQTSAEMVAIESIKKPVQQPRRYFDPQKLAQLVSSVQQHGILEPLLIRPTSNQVEYELVAGERRYRAALEAGLKQVPAVIKTLTDEEALHLSLVENLLRVDLNPIEETEGILQLLSLHLGKEMEQITLMLYRMQNEVKGKVTQNVLGSHEGNKVLEIFDSLGTISWESFVNSRLPLLNLPTEVATALREGKIAYTKATAIARVKDEKVREKLLRDAIKHNWSLSEIKERIKALRPSKEIPHLKSRWRDTSSRLQKTKVWENPDKQQQLEELLSQIEALIESE